MTVPNLLSCLRLLLVPVLLLLAWNGEKTAFLWLLVTAFVTDALDGFIARRFNQMSELGARLDSWADAAVYISLPLAAWWLWPAVITQQALWMALIIGSVVVPAVAGLLRFGQFTSYHTWFAKAAAALTAVATVLLFAFGLELTFQVAAVVCVIAALEEIAITVVMDRPLSNVRNLRHALAAREARGRR